MSNVIRSLMVRIGVDLSQAQKGFTQAAKDLDKLGRKMSAAGSTLTKGLTLPAIAAVAGLGALVTKTTAAAGEIERLSSVTGLSTDRIQELSYAGAKLSVDLGTITGAQSKLINAMSAAKAGTKTQTDLFGRLGIAVVDSTGKLRDSNDVFDDALIALGAMSDETERDAMSLKLFGKSALEMNPLIKAGGAEIRRLSREAHDAGAVMSGESVQAMDRFKNGLDAMKLTLTTAASKIAMALMPVLERIVPVIQTHVVPAIERIGEVVSGIIDWFERLTPTQQGFVFWSSAIVLAIGPVLQAIGGLATGISSLMSLMTALGGAGAAGGLATALGGVSAAALAAAGAIAEILIPLAAVAGLAVMLNNIAAAPTTAAMLADVEKARQNGVTAEPVPGAAPEKKTTAVPGSQGPYKPGTGPYATNAAGVPNWWNPNYGKPQTPTDKQIIESVKSYVDPVTKAQQQMAEAAAAWEASQKRLNEEMKRTEAAAKRAAALEAFRNTVRSLAQAVMEAARQFANFAGAFDRVERDPVSGSRLANRMKGQLKAVQDWATAMKDLKGKVSAALYRELLNLGPGAVDSIMALVRDEGALADYASAWQQKYDIAATMGAEAAKENYRVDQLIEKQINTINVTGADPEKVADLVVKKLRLAGVR